MPHHHVGIKPQSCINTELWVGPAEERGEPPTLPRIHEEKDSIVARHQPLQRLHVWSNLLYGLGYTRESEEVGGNWPMGNQIPPYTCDSPRQKSKFCHVFRSPHYITYRWTSAKGGAHRLFVMCEYSISLIRHRGYYFFRCSFQYGYNLRVAFISSADSNNAWMRYTQAIQLGLIDAGSSMCSLSVLLSAVEMSLRTQIALEIAQWAPATIISTHVRALCILVAATIRGWLLLEGGYYSRVATIRGWLLLEGSYY